MNTFGYCLSSVFTPDLKGTNSMSSCVFSLCHAEEQFSVDSRWNILNSKALPAELSKIVVMAC